MRIIIFFLCFMLFIGACVPEGDIVEPEPKVYDTIAPTDKPIDSTDKDF